MNGCQETSRFLGLTLDTVQGKNADGGVTPLKQNRNRQTSESIDLAKNKKRYKTLRSATRWIVSEHCLHNTAEKTS